MDHINAIFFWSWMIFIAYWISSSIGTKKTSYGHTWLQVLIFIISGTQVQNIKNILANHIFKPLGDKIGSLGIIICITGILIAICSKYYLGKDWGLPGTVKENQKLVTSGPYRFVRHPIYAGILLAFLGSSLLKGGNWFIIFAFFSVYFIYAAMSEEISLNSRFPEQYPKYRKKTKMFIPFIF